MKVRLAVENDLLEILSIHKYWLGQNSENPNGFLFGEPYTYDDLIPLIFRDQIAVTKEKGIVTGYFLLDDCSKNVTTKQYIGYLKELMETENLGYSFDTVCPRAQIAIDQSFLNKNISAVLTRFLIQKNCKKFQAIFSTVSKENKQLNKHLKNGWKIIGGTDELHFVILDQKNEHSNVSLQFP